MFAGVPLRQFFRYPPNTAIYRRHDDRPHHLRTGTGRIFCMACGKVAIADAGSHRVGILQLQKHPLIGSQEMNRNLLQRFGLVVLLAFIAVILGPRSAFAHTGVGPAHDLLHGLAHPLTGLDHILAMFAVGLWAAQRGGRAIWFVPLTFVLVMTVGTFLGASSASIPFVEPGIAISVLVMGLFVAAAI